VVGEHRIVVIHDRFGLALHGEFARVEQDGVVANGLDGLFVVGDDEQGGTLLPELTDAVKALVLEVCITH
jgi:hypothetical protein